MSSLVSRTGGPAGRREGGDDTTDDTAGIKLITDQESESYSWPRYDPGGGLVLIRPHRRLGSHYSINPYFRGSEKPTDFPGKILNHNTPSQVW